MYSLLLSCAECLVALLQCSMSFMALQKLSFCRKAPQDLFSLTSAFKEVLQHKVLDICGIWLVYMLLIPQFPGSYFGLSSMQNLSFRQVKELENPVKFGWSLKSCLSGEAWGGGREGGGRTISTCTSFH